VTVFYPSSARCVSSSAEVYITLLTILLAKTFQSFVVRKNMDEDTDDGPKLPCRSSRWHQIYQWYSEMGEVKVEKALQAKHTVPTQ